MRSGAGGYGLLSSIYGVGMGLAPLLLLRWKRRRVTTLLLLLGIFLDGLGTLLTGLAPVLLLAALAQLLAGCGNGFESVSNNALIQETVPRKMPGRVFGTVWKQHLYRFRCRICCWRVVANGTPGACNLCAGRSRRADSLPARLDYSPAFTG